MKIDKMIVANVTSSMHEALSSYKEMKKTNEKQLFQIKVTYARIYSNWLLEVLTQVIVADSWSVYYTSSFKHY